VDINRFNGLTKSVSTLLSRRTIASTLGLGALALPGLAGAKKRRKKKKKKRCRPSCTGGHLCQRGRCVCPSGSLECQGTCCAPGKGCVSGTCITLQADCPAGVDICAVGTAFCDGGIECGCRVSTEGTTRCAATGRLSEADTCTSSADCATFFPDVPGAFCVNAPEGCFSDFYCAAPCPV
jgi:hypothetical protein